MIMSVPTRGRGPISSAVCWLSVCLSCIRHRFLYFTRPFPVGMLLEMGLFNLKDDKTSAKNLFKIITTLLIMLNLVNEWLPSWLTKQPCAWTKGGKIDCLFEWLAGWFVAGFLSAFYTDNLTDLTDWLTKWLTNWKLAKASETDTFQSPNSSAN